MFLKSKSVTKQPLTQAQNFPKPTSKDQEKAKEVIVVSTHFPFLWQLFFLTQVDHIPRNSVRKRNSPSYVLRMPFLRCSSFFSLAIYPRLGDLYLSDSGTIFVMLCYVKYTHAHWEGSHADAFHGQTLCAENIVWLCFQFLIPFEIIVCASNSRRQFQRLQRAVALTRL